jgi:plastocyanin
MRTRTTTSIAVMVLLTLGLAACSSDDGDSGGSTPSSAASASGGAGDLTITAEDFSFSPDTLAVPSGESTITVTNSGSVEHNFTLDDDSVSEDVEPGESVTVTVDVSADAPFHCKYHPDQMTGTLTVA